MILYHGSNVAVEQIDLAKSKPNKDFGSGFYLSAEKGQAIEMARYKSIQLGGNPIVSVFELESDTLEIEGKD